MCATCPFREGSPYAHLADDLCHSTGSNNAINRRTGKPARICRGARDLQLQVFTAIGVLTAPTDEAWDAKCRELNLK
jgi:hypothetical protein